jgi:hypothetical protein
LTGSLRAARAWREEEGEEEEEEELVDEFAAAI